MMLRTLLCGFGLFYAANVFAICLPTDHWRYCEDEVLPYGDTCVVGSMTAEFLAPGTAIHVEIEQVVGENADGLSAGDSLDFEFFEATSDIHGPNSGFGTGRRVVCLTESSVSYVVNVRDDAIIGTDVNVYEAMLAYVGEADCVNLFLDNPGSCSDGLDCSQAGTAASPTLAFLSVVIFFSRRRFN